MPWQEKDLMSLKKEFIQEAAKQYISFSELCSRYGISRKTGYKWQSRYHCDLQPSLADHSRRTHKSPKATSSEVTSSIIALRVKHPSWGGRKIRAVLQRNGEQTIPAASTISGILKRKGLIKGLSLENLNTHRFEHEAPNHLWQMDFKGNFAYEGNKRCHPLTVLDDHSRFSLTLTACDNERRITVENRLLRVFERYGLPDRINVDNGAPWGSIFAVCRYTTLSLWLIDHGIKVTYSRPRHPQTNGKIERFHRTIKAELLNQRYYKSLSDIQSHFDRWREVYNHERPHEAIAMQVPADRYKLSYRTYNDKVDEYSYANDYRVKITDQRGRIHINGKTLFIGVPFSKRMIGLRETLSEHCYELYYRHQLLGKINLSMIPKGETINIYSRGAHRA